MGAGEQVSWTVPSEWLGDGEEAAWLVLRSNAERNSYTVKLVSFGDLLKNSCWIIFHSSGMHISLHFTGVHFSDSEHHTQV
jgi:hypothetical protein